MKTLTSSGSILGVFNSIEVVADGLVADGVLFGLEALGEYAIVEGDPPSRDRHEWDGEAWVLKPLTAPELAAAIAKGRAIIDAESDAIRAAVLGSRTTEYQEAYADALAYKAAGYTGAIPDGVKSWFDAKTAAGAGWTAQDCADDIIATGLGWKAEDKAIRAARLFQKEQASAATTQAGIDAAVAEWRGFAVSARRKLGLPALPA